MASMDKPRPGLSNILSSSIIKWTHCLPCSCTTVFFSCTAFSQEQLEQSGVQLTSSFLPWDVGNASQANLLLIDFQLAAALIG